VRTAGNGVVRATGKLVNMSKVQVILKLGTYNGMPYYVLTAYLVP
jgi:Bacterial CdiA-CT RNAse A domain